MQAMEVPLYENRRENIDKLLERTRSLFGIEIQNLTQKEVTVETERILHELVANDIDGSDIFAFILPHTASSEDLKSGNSPYAKVYRALFHISATKTYKEDSKLQLMVRALQNTVDQDPQMIGPAALWDIAKEIIWRKDIPSHAKSSLLGSMTYALAFFDTEAYETELLNNLDFEKTQNYTEVAHMLEAVKQFWSAGHESYAEDRAVPDFYLRALRKLQETPGTNYLLVVRASEILAMLEQSEDFPNEAGDLRPFELSRNIYASTQVGEIVTVASEKTFEDIQQAIKDFDENEKQLRPPQWMVDEAVARGETWISWQPPSELLSIREELFNEMHKHVTVPIDEMLGELGGVTSEEKQGLLFDYEYLVSRPVRELLQREFSFELKDLTIQEQFHFLNYLKHTTVETAETMRLFVKLYGRDGMRTFLSLERGDASLGDSIVAFGQHDEIAGTVFRYYSDLLTSADRAEHLVRTVSDCEGNTCTTLANQVRENILNRAQKDLEKAVRTYDPSKVATQIENYVATAKEYVALLQEVGTGNIEAVPAAALTEEDRVRMVDLLQKNYSALYPGSENDVFRSAVAGSLIKSFDSTGTTYRVLRDRGKIVSFNRFDSLRDSDGREVSYFGSFNADPAYSGVGSFMLEETIKDQLENGRPMMAHCDPAQAITRKYIEDGFIATRFYQLAGKPSFEIWRSKESIGMFESKGKSVTELFALAEGTASIVLREQSSAETYPELQTDMALTRYVTHQGKTYLVFEKINDTLRVAFTPPQEQMKQAA